MPAFLERLLIGALVIFIVKIVVEFLQLDATASRALIGIAIIGAVIYIVFGQLLGL